MVMVVNHTHTPPVPPPRFRPGRTVDGIKTVLRFDESGCLFRFGGPPPSLRSNEERNTDRVFSGDSGGGGDSPG